MSAPASTVIPGGATVKSQKTRMQLDPIVVMLTGVLLLLGIIMVGSASVALAAQEGVALADAATVLGGDTRYFADHAHFSDEGAARMGALLADVVLRVRATSLASTPTR